MIKYVEEIGMYECDVCGAQFEKVRAFNRKNDLDVFVFCPYCTIAANVSVDSPCATIERDREIARMGARPISKEDKGVKFDEGKLRWDLVPWSPLEQVVRVLTYGASKYSDNNWQKVKGAKERYESALMRHFKAHVTGETTSKENGVELWHLAQVVCNALFLLHFEQTGYPEEE